AVGREVKASPDRANKTVALYGQLLVGMTGLAELDGQPTDEWVIDTLYDTDPTIWPLTLAAAATRSVQGIRASWRGKGLTFVAVGFTPSSPTPPLEWMPGRWAITNMYDQDKRLLAQPSRKFHFHRYRH